MRGQHHIAHLHTNPHWGGGEYQILHLVKGLVKRMVRTTLFTHPYGMLFSRAEESGLPVAGIPHAAFLPVLPFCLNSLCRTLTETGVDLLHVHDALAATIGVGVSRRTGIPVVLSRRVASPIRGNMFSRSKYSSRNFAAVIAISETVKNAFVNSSGYPAERVFVAPSGIDIQEMDKVERDEEFRKGCGGTFIACGIGKLSRKKNWRFMVEVAARLATEGHDIQWVLAGDGPERQRLEDMVAKLGLRDRFHLLGFMRDATRILKSADVLFFPSLMEGASVTVRAAMILGTPVVAVDAPGTMESLAGHGWAVRPDDVETAAKSVIEALTNQEKREAVCKAARESAISRFSLDRTVDDTIAVYERVLET